MAGLNAKKAATGVVPVTALVSSSKQLPDSQQSTRSYFFAAGAGGGVGAEPLAGAVGAEPLAGAVGGVGAEPLVVLFAGVSTFFLAIPATLRQ